MPRRRKSNMLSNLYADSIATATTLAIRVPQLLSGTMSKAETHRMVAEKIAAAREGWVKGAAAAGRIAMRKPKRSTRAVAADTLAIFDAAFGPARRKVRANAKRLTKRSG